MSSISFKKFWCGIKGDYVIGAVLASEIDEIVKDNFGRTLTDKERECIFDALLESNSDDERMSWISSSIEEALDVKFPNNEVIC